MKFHSVEFSTADEAVGHLQRTPTNRYSDGSDMTHRLIILIKHLLGADKTKVILTLLDAAYSIHVARSVVCLSVCWAHR